MQHSETLGELAKALSKAQGEIENAHKNTLNPHFRKNYADLAEIINTTRPVLTKYGLAVVQLPGMSDGLATVETILTHESGEWLSGVAASPIAKADPQGVGSALTYLRRYSLAAVCNIAQEDDDAEAAAGRRSEAPQVARTTNASANGRFTKEVDATDAQTALIARLMKSSTITDEERASIQAKLDKGMVKKQASDAIEWLNAQIKEREQQPAGV